MFRMGDGGKYVHLSMPISTTHNCSHYLLVSYIAKVIYSQVMFTWSTT